MEMTPSRIGARAELRVTAALIGAEKRVYLPCFAADSRVDLVYEDEAGFHRVQVKSAVRHGDVIHFRSCSNTNNTRQDYRGEVDAIGVYLPEFDEVFLVPVDEAPARAGHLRLGPPRNNQVKGIRWARDYLLKAPPAPS